MVAVNAVIRVDIDASAANAGLAGMAAQMQRFNKGMIAGAGKMQAAQIAAAKKQAQYLNSQGQWLASTGSMMSRAAQMHKQFDKGTFASMGQWRETSAKATKAMGANAVMNQMAAQRVRALQTQYVSLGKGVDGVNQVMKAQPTGMIKQWGADAMFAQQKAVLFHRRLQMGGNSMINWGKNTQWAGRQMMVGMAIPLGIAAVGAVRSFKDIEQASISFRRVYGDSVKDTAQANGVLKQVMGEVGQEYTKYGVAMSDTIGVAARAAATGQKGDALVGTTRETLRLATLGQLDYDQALESTIATQTAFGVSTNGLTRVTDFLNAAENQTILSMSDMTKAIPRVAPVIKGLGGDVEDLGVLMTALRAGGVTAEQGANALKSGLASLINPTSSATEAMKSFGIPLDKIVNANKGDLIGTVQDFGKALKTLPKFEQQQALESLFGKYQYARMGALFRNINGKQAQQTAKLSKSSNARLAAFSSQEMDQIADSALNKFQGAVERLKVAAAPFGEAILQVAAPVLDVLANGLNAITNNDFAKWATAGVLGLTALATVGTMLTGVFAQMGGYMMKGRAAMKNMGSILRGRGSLRYSSLDELEAATANEALARSASAAQTALYAEKGAVTQLAAALNAMNAELREGVALQAAATGAGKRPPGGAAPTVPAPRPPTQPTAPGGGGAAVPMPRVAPPVTARQSGREFQAGHVGGSAALTKAQVASLSKNAGRADVKAWAAGLLEQDSVKKAADSAQVAKALTGKNILMTSDLNGQLNKAGSQGGIGSASKAMWLESLRTSGAYAMSNPLRMMGVRSNDPMAAKYATSMFDSFARSVAAHPEQFLNEATAGKYLDDAARKTFAGDPKRLADYEKLNLPNAVTVADGSRRGIKTGLPGEGLLPDYGGASKPELMNWANVGDMDIGGGTLDAIDGALGGLAGAAGSASGALERLAGAAASAAGAQSAGSKTGGAMPKTGAFVTPDGKAYPVANVSGLPKVGGPSSPLTSGARSAAIVDRQIADVERQRQSAYSRGYFAQQAELEKSQREQSAKQSLWNRMRAGGVFGGGTRGMSPEEKANYKANMQNKVSGKLMAFGMAADAVTMGLAMTGHEIPPWTHAIGMSAMAIGMMPGAITPVISLLSNPVTGALAAVAAAAGAGVVAWKFLNNRAAAAGEAAGNYAIASNQTTEALANQYGTSTLAQQVLDRRAAKAAEASVEDVQGAKKVSQSEVGQNISQGYADVIARGGSIQSAQESMVSNLATAVFQEAMTVGQARAFASESVGDVQGAQVSNQLNSLIGKNGQVIAKDPTGFATDSLLRSQSVALDASNKAAVSQTDFWDNYGAAMESGSASMVDFGTAFDTDAGDSWFEPERVKDLFGGLANWSSGILNKTSLGGFPLLSGLQSAGRQSTAGAEANAYASTVWSNALQQGYATRLAAEERLRLTVQARDKAQKQMTAAEKANPGGFKNDKAWQTASQQVEKYNNAISQGRQGLKEFDNTYASMAGMGMKQFAGLGQTADGLTKQNQQLETQRTALEALYSQDPDKAAAYVMEQGSMQMKADSLATGADGTIDEAKRNQLMYAYQQASLDGLDPGSMGALDSITGGAGLESLPQLMNLTSGDMLGQILTQAQQFKGESNIIGEALMSAQTGKEVSTLKDKLGEFVQMAPKAQKALQGAFGEASLNDIKKWGRGLENNNLTVKDILDSLGIDRGGTPTGDKGDGGDGGPRPTPPPTPKTPPKTTPPPFSNPLDPFTGGPKPPPGTPGYTPFSFGQPPTPTPTTPPKNLPFVNPLTPFGLKPQATPKPPPAPKAPPPAKTKPVEIKTKYAKPSNAGVLKTKGKAIEIKTKYGKPANQSALKPKGKNVEIKTKYAKPGNQGALKPKGNLQVKTKYAKPGNQGSLKPKPVTIKAKYSKPAPPPKPAPVDQKVNRSIGSDETKQKPPELPQTITREMQPGNSLDPAPDLPQTVNRSANPGNTMIPPPPVTQIVIRKTVPGSAFGGPVHLAGGGEPTTRGNFSGRRVSGPGGPMEDKVPAWLSPGEFVVRQRAVKKYGTTFMSKINSGSIDPKSVVHLKDGSGKDDGSKPKKDKDEGSGGGGGDKWSWKKDVINPLNKTLNAAQRGLKLIGLKNKRTGGVIGKSALMDQIGDDPKALKKFLHMNNKKKKDFVQKVEKAVVQSEFVSFRTESALAQKLNDKRVALAKKRGIRLLALDDAELKQYLSVEGKNKKQRERKRNAIIRRATKRIKAQERFETQSGVLTRMQELKDAANYSDRFDNKKLQGLTPLAMQNLSEEDFARISKLPGPALQKFIDSLNEAADATLQSTQAARTEAQATLAQTQNSLKNAKATRGITRAIQDLEEQIGYVNMSAGERSQEAASLLEQRAQSFYDQASARADKEVYDKTGKTRQQHEAEMQRDQAAIGRQQLIQEAANIEITKINRAYDEQQKLLDKIAQSQQIISQLQKGRLSVAAALSSGDIAAAAAAAQEQRAAETQAGLDLMQQGLNDEREARVKEYQDLIDDAQDEIDQLNLQISTTQSMIDTTVAGYQSAAAESAEFWDVATTNLKASDSYWKAINADIEHHIKLLKQIDPKVFTPQTTKPTPPKKTTTKTPTDDDDPNDGGDREEARRNKARAIAAKARVKANRTLAKAQDAQKEADDTQTKKDDKIIARAKKKAKVLKKLGHQADLAAEEGDIEKTKRLKAKVMKKVPAVKKLLTEADAITQRAQVDQAQDRVAKLKKDLAGQKDVPAQKKVLERTQAQIEKAKKDVVKEKKEAQKAEKKAEKISPKKKEGGKDKKPKRHAFGGFVGGYGNTDKVSAMLTPGEFVMTKGAASRFGRALEKVNSPSFRFADKAGTFGGGRGEYEGNVYNVTINANGVADAEEIATITLNKMKQLDSMRVREMRKF